MPAEKINRFAECGGELLRISAAETVFGIRQEHELELGAVALEFLGHHPGLLGHNVGIGGAVEQKRRRVGGGHASDREGRDLP